MRANSHRRRWLRRDDQVLHNFSSERRRICEPVGKNVVFAALETEAKEEAGCMIYVLGDSKYMRVVVD
jgi:hypothetical protein